MCKHITWATILFAFHYSHLKGQQDVKILENIQVQCLIHSVHDMNSHSRELIFFFFLLLLFTQTQPMSFHSPLYTLCWQSDTSKLNSGLRFWRHESFKWSIMYLSSSLDLIKSVRRKARLIVTDMILGSGTFCLFTAVVFVSGLKQGWIFAA